MAGQNITAADTIIELVIAELYPSGFNLVEFEAQNIFEMGDTDMAEYQRTADGKLLGGFVYGDLSWTFHLAASSPSIKYIDNWQNTQIATRSVLRANGTVIQPSLGKKYIMTNGILQRARRMPSAGRVLQPVTGLIQWETVTPAAYSA
ncbi:TPA: hypothetical protein MM157_005334 [Klebsiella variicola subsp. variicola]|nr:hypothetical protein [Klebsiella variicola]HBR8097489.1 hypothetical protein [Klebsiella variicola subsp. variicola]HDU4475132.1 hypothetical protein [Klebsiella pneumoniae subsp. ozaenae]HBS3663220.1 hypothetical protein [Klebsiella variicola subsp. variicola]HBZ8009428.1 hypothetical protein [Klebsiella variicola subsp. variicola]